MNDELPIYVGPDGTEHRDPWVSIIFIQDHQYDDDELEQLVQSTPFDATMVADYLAQWDYGTENDSAATTDHDPHLGSDPWTDVYDVTIADGHDYVLMVSRTFDFVSLSRRPLDWEDGEFAS